MHKFCLFAIICLTLVSAAEQPEVVQYEEPAFTTIERESDIKRVLEHITRLSETGTKGGARVAAKIIASRVHTRQEFFQQIYKTLHRSPFAGLLPRCLCKISTCSLPRCFAMCTSDEVLQKEAFDCTSCVGECIPMFMRCIFGVDG